MKHLLLIIAMTLSLLVFSQYSWSEFGPPDTVANKIKIFGNQWENRCACIFTDYGMYVNEDYPSRDWYYYNEFYLIDAIDYSEDEIIIILSGGSYSDGIYLYNLKTNSKEIIEYGYYPQFIDRVGYDGYYFVGFPHGLYFSEDGLNWEADLYFSDMNCIGFASNPHYESMAVITDEPTNNVYYREDFESEWEQINSDFHMSQITMVYGLGGICTDEQDCGFYKLQGSEWNLTLESESLHAIGHDNEGSFFLGWREPQGGHQGVARYKGNELAFYNIGLPNLNIRGFTTDHDIVGGGVIYCCTDGGNFVCNGYTTGLEELIEGDHKNSIKPNPCKEKFQINLPTNSIELLSIELYNLSGKLITSQFDFNPNDLIEIDMRHLPQGIYLCVIETDSGNYSEKVVKI